MNRRLQGQGFTLLEVMIAAVLSAFLLVMISGMWTGLGRSMTENLADCRVTAEAGLAAEALRRDLSGSLPEATTGEKQRGRLVGRLVIGDERLMLCFDGSPTNGSADWTHPDDVVMYELRGEQLVRTAGMAGSAFVVAGGVEEFKVTDVGSGVRLELTLRRRSVRRNYTFVAHEP